MNGCLPEKATYLSVSTGNSEFRGRILYAGLGKPLQGAG